MARLPARGARSGGGPFAGFGIQMPPIVKVLAASIFILSIIGAVGARNGFPLLQWTAAFPELVLKGQLWRLFTSALFEIDPLSLIFTLIVLVTLGSDLALRWGPVRFVLNYLGFNALVVAAVCGLSLLVPVLSQMPFMGSRLVQEMFIILWATYYPTRQLRFGFVLPLAGRQIIYATIGLTVLFALFSGYLPFVPHFIAQAIALAIAFAPTPRTLWLESRLRGLEKQRRASHLKSVPRPLGDDEDPPSGGRWLN